MELDDLRRQWQRPQPATDPAALNTTELRQLLAQKSGSIIAQLRLFTPHPGKNEKGFFEKVKEYFQ